MRREASRFRRLCCLLDLPNSIRAACLMWVFAESCCYRQQFVLRHAASNRWLQHAARSPGLLTRWSSTMHLRYSGGIRRSTSFWGVWASIDRVFLSKPRSDSEQRGTTCCCRSCLPFIAFHPHSFSQVCPSSTYSSLM